MVPDFNAWLDEQYKKSGSDKEYSFHGSDTGLPGLYRNLHLINDDQMIILINIQIKKKSNQESFQWKSLKVLLIIFLQLSVEIKIFNN